MANEEWASALAESENPQLRDAGLWAKCFVEAEGNEIKARVAYVKQKMADIKPVQPALASAPVQREVGYCPNCNYELSMTADACPNCKAIFDKHGWSPTKTREGNPRNADQFSAPVAVNKNSGRLWKWVLGVPVGGFALVMIVGSCAGRDPNVAARVSEKDAISYCWEQQAKKSLDPATARFAASACERMESDFRTKWGFNP